MPVNETAEFWFRNFRIWFRNAFGKSPKLPLVVSIWFRNGSVIESFWGCQWVIAC